MGLSWNSYLGNLKLIKLITDFTLVDEEGGQIIKGGEERGLLLYKGGTVCNVRFSDTAASAICREMGHYRHVSWDSSDRWSIQVCRMRIKKK